MKIVLLGGGYTSTWTYKHLAKHSYIKEQIAANKLEIIIVTNNPFHAFHGFTGEAIAGMVPDNLRYTPVSEVCPLAKIIEGQVAEINTDKKLVYYIGKDGKEAQLDYEHLVIGTGSIDNLEKIEGADKFAMGVKHLYALQEINEKLLNIAHDPVKHVRQKEKLSLVVIGAGFAGVEIAANIKEYLDKLQKQYIKLNDYQVEVYLISATERILPQINQEFHIMTNYCERELLKYDVKILNNTKVAKLENHNVVLDNGNVIMADVIILAAGQKPIYIKGLEKFVKSADNRIDVNQYLQIPSENNLWVGGDMAKVLHRSKKFHCPPNALWAIKQGTWIGENIYRSLVKKSLKSFDFYGLGQAACLGVGKGTNELYGIQMTGWVAWVVRIGFFLYFMPSRKSIPKVIKALSNSLTK